MISSYGYLILFYSNAILDSDPSPAREYTSYSLRGFNRSIFRYLQTEILESPAQAQTGQMVLPGFEGLMGFSVVS